MKTIVALTAAVFAAVSGISIVAGQDKPAPAAAQSISSSPAEGTLKFITHRIGNYRSEAVGVGDFNNDGKPDIIAGAYLYLAPDFKALKIRSPKGKVDDNGKGYCMDFMNLPLDVDGDGLLDVVSCGWFEKAAWWCRNTGPGGGEWPETIMEKEGGNYETGDLCDIDGDGKANEILPHTASTFWMEVVKGSDGKNQVVKHVVCDKKMSWGAGVGDVNGDGRPDIIRPEAWFEAPADPRKGQWKQHPLGLAGLKGKVTQTCQSVAYDVNGDGLNDVITGAAHDYGLFWYEQVKAPAGGSPTFKQHVIDSSWSQVHSLVLADIDGCGTGEIVTGKRFMAHNGGDPGASEPLGVYYYKLNRGPRPGWAKHIISHDEGIGSGLNLVAADMDADGDLDVIVTGKYGGPVWFENTLKSADDGGFVPMFNGKDLTGWQTKGNWVVEQDGTVTLKPRPGERGWQRYDAYLTTQRKYGDFVIDLEFKFERGGNSGVFLRVGDPNSQVNSGFEVQILDTYGKKQLTAHDCGGVIGTAIPSRNMVKPAGQWNRYTITCKGPNVKVVLNGEQIVDLDLSKSGLKDRPSSGYIGFQDEAKPVWYRNVRIKELTQEKESE